MMRRTPTSTRTDTLFPYTTLVRSLCCRDFLGIVGRGDEDRLRQLLRRAPTRMLVLHIFARRERQHRFYHLGVAARDGDHERGRIAAAPQHHRTTDRPCPAYGAERRRAHARNQVTKSHSVCSLPS